MITKDTCPYYGRLFKANGIAMTIPTMQTTPLGAVTLTVMDDKVIMSDVNGTVEKKWSLIKQEEAKFIFEDQDSSQWILGEKLFSYTVVKRGLHISFILS